MPPVFAAPLVYQINEDGPKKFPIKEFDVTSDPAALPAGKMAEFRNSFSYSFKYVGQTVSSPSFISFSTAGAAAGDCGSITVNSNTNAAYF